jgi:putative transposase
VLEVSTSRYNAWRKREPSARTQSDAQLGNKIVELHKLSREIYGAPKLHADLKDLGIRIGRKRVARLMALHGIAGTNRRKGCKTTWRNRDARPAPDLVKRTFKASGPNQLWVADITYVPTCTTEYLNL